MQLSPTPRHAARRPHRDSMGRHRRWAHLEQVRRREGVEGLGDGRMVGDGDGGAEREHFSAQHRYEATNWNIRVIDVIS